MRFERSVTPVEGSKLFARLDVNSRLSITRVRDSGAFLAVLWAQLGEPSPREGGFEYHVHDRHTNLSFVAYADVCGPCYAGDERQLHALRTVIEAFERTLDQTPPLDCAFVYGSRVLGYRRGHSFDIADRRQPASRERRQH